METKGLCPNENGLSLGHIQPFSVVPCFRRTGGGVVRPVVLRFPALSPLR